MHEYAFDVKLFAVLRIRARSLKAARKAAEEVLDAADLSAVKLPDPHVRITEASLSTDDMEHFEPFEIDGEDTDLD